MWDLDLFPEQASTFASRVDHLYYFLVAVTAFFGTLIMALLVYFSIKYRRRSENEKPPPEYANLRLEIAWIIIPFILVMVIFAWSADVFIELRTPPADCSEIYVVGKQWMWKIQHPTGQREINELHVPVGIPVKLIMTSEDVIHSFYVPAFRTKMDVLPNRYTTLWFTASQPGSYHLFCAEYCGTGHSHMIGKVNVLEAPEYQTWLESGLVGEPLAVAGERLFERVGCTTCHSTVSTERGPALAGIYARNVRLKGGEEIVADEDYLRESILNPNAKITEGYEPLMPSYQGQLDEEDLVKLVAYLKSLVPPESRNQ